MRTSVTLQGTAADEEVIWETKLYKIISTAVCIGGDIKIKIYV